MFKSSFFSHHHHYYTITIIIISCRNSSESVTIMVSGQSPPGQNSPDKPPETFVSRGSGHFPLDILPDNFPSSFLHGVGNSLFHHPPIYNTNRSTVNVYKIGGGISVRSMGGECPCGICPGEMSTLASMARLRVMVTVWWWFCSGSVPV